MPAWPLLIALGVGLGVALRFDLLRLPIPVSVGLVTAGVVLALRAGLAGGGDLDGPGLWSGALGAGLAALIFGGWGALSRGLGWGETALLSAVGACFGFPHAAAASVFIALAGAVLAIAQVVRKRAAPDATHGRMQAGASGHQIPYAVAIVAGCVVTVAWAWAEQ